MDCLIAGIVLTLVSATALAEDLPPEDAGQNQINVNSLPLPPGESYAVIVDGPATVAKREPISDEPSDSTWETRGEPVLVRATPSNKARVIAEVAGGKTVLVYGEPIKREGISWSDVDCLGMRGWVPHDRLKHSEDAGSGGLKWDLRAFSPSGKVVVEFTNHGSGYISVLKDGTGREEYGLDLENEGALYVGSKVLFSEDESLFALEHGGASMGGEVFVFGRNGRGRFMNRNLKLAKRSWQLIRKAGLIPAEARLTHFYMRPDKTREKGFEMSVAGDYSLNNQTNFGPFRVMWNWQHDELTLLK